MDREQRPRTIEQSVDPNRQLIAAKPKDGEDPMSIFDHMTRIVAELKRLDTNLDQSLVLSTFVRPWPNKYGFLKQGLEGQDFDRGDLLERVKAPYSSLNGQSRDHDFVSQGRQSEKDGDRIPCYSFQGFRQVSKVWPSRK